VSETSCKHRRCYPRATPQSRVWGRASSAGRGLQTSESGHFPRTGARRGPVNGTDAAPPVVVDAGGRRRSERKRAEAFGRRAATDDRPSAREAEWTPEHEHSSSPSAVHRTAPATAAHSRRRGTGPAASSSRSGARSSTHRDSRSSCSNSARPFSALNAPARTKRAGNSSTEGCTPAKRLQGHCRYETHALGCYLTTTEANTGSTNWRQTTRTCPISDWRNHASLRAFARALARPPASTFNPKVAGSSPARPMEKSCKTDPFVAGVGNSSQRRIKGRSMPCAP
jgi:hypothetical protein